MPLRADLTGWALLLIAIGISYFVCLKASKEGSKLFRNGGYTIGIIILIASLILVIAGLKGHLRRRVPAPVRRTSRSRSTTRTGEIPKLPTRIPVMPGQQGTTLPGE